MSFNSLKSVAVDFRLGSHPIQEVLQVDGVAIPQRKEARHLGVCLASDLRWNSHVSHLIQSAGPIHLCQNLGYQHRLSSSVIRRFFIAFVRPKLEYCNAVWCGLPRSQAIRLEKLQLKVAKAFVRCRDLSHPQVLRAAKLPTLSWRRMDHCLSALWNLVKGIGPPALLDAGLPALASTRSVPALRAGHSLWQFPLCSLSCHQSSFLCHTIPLWNNLPSSVVSSSSLVLFQRSVCS